MKILNPQSSILNPIKGQSLIEVLLIIVLVTVVISASVGFLMESYASTQFVSDQTTAVYLASEGIELVKNLIDANYINSGVAWNSGLNDNGNYEVEYLSSNLDPIAISEEARKLKFDQDKYVYNYKDGLETPYSRIIQIENFPGLPENPVGIKVSSIVNWTSRRCPASGCRVELQAYFYDWRQ